MRYRAGENPFHKDDLKNLFSGDRELSPAFTPPKFEAQQPAHLVSAEIIEISDAATSQIPAGIIEASNPPSSDAAVAA